MLELSLNLAQLLVLDSFCGTRRRGRMSFGALLSCSSHRLGQDFHRRVAEAVGTWSDEMAGDKTLVEIG